MSASSPDNSRTRLLQAGKTLFAKLGYESTPTSVLAREAGTSESQLVRYFGGKAGLLEAILEESWKPLNARVSNLLPDARDARTAVTAVLASVLTTFEADDEVATIFLFEGRRIRGESHAITLSSGYMQFADVIHRLIRRGQKDGTFAPAFESAALAAAFLGAVEGMVRERVLARRGGATRPYSDKQIHRVFEAMLDAFAPEAPRP
jgi:AcrR family transcriptional regulator